LVDPTQGTPVSARLPAVFIALLFTLAALPASATERLVAFGGGPPPAAAVARFVDWAGQRQADILVISWASESAQLAYADFSEEIQPFHPGRVEPAPTPAELSRSKAAFLAQLRRATGVFFTGGDQNRVMDVLADSDLLPALRQRYHDGVVFGGTSAGTAILSHRMFTGRGNFDVVDPRAVEMREGLGLITQAVIDQHFFKRRRENRLFSTMLKGPEPLGLGIDEGGALAVVDGRYAQVLGPKSVMIVDAKAQPGKLTVQLLRSGETFDLVERRPR
jgi:cyanophycinase